MTLTETKPNILWIQTDEQRPDSLGCYGSRWAKTPHIDALADSGTVMQTAVCQSPACVPSRCSQITARYPHEIGIVNNSVLGSGRGYPAGVTPFPAVFEAAGYTTVQIGKGHTMSNPWGRAVSLDQEFRPYCDARGLTSDYDEADYRVVHRPDERALILAGSYPGGEDNPDRHKTDACLQFLRGSRKGDAPFLLHLSYIWPHTPVLVPSPWENTYRAGEIPVKYYDRSAYETRSQCDRAMDGNLFDLEEDPHEKKDLFEEKEYRNVVGSLCGTIASWLEATPADPRLRAEG